MFHQNLCLSIVKVNLKRAECNNVFRSIIMIQDFTYIVSW